MSAEFLQIRPGLKKVKESVPLLKADVHLDQGLDFDVMSYLNHIGFFGSNCASDFGVKVPFSIVFKKVLYGYYLKKVTWNILNFPSWKCSEYKEVGGN